MNVSLSPASSSPRRVHDHVVHFASPLADVTDCGRPVDDVPHVRVQSPQITCITCRGLATKPHRVGRMAA